MTTMTAMTTMMTMATINDDDDDDDNDDDDDDDDDEQIDDWPSFLVVDPPTKCFKRRDTKTGSQLTSLSSSQNLHQLVEILSRFGGPIKATIWRKY